MVKKLFDILPPEKIKQSYSPVAQEFKEPHFQKEETGVRKPPVKKNIILIPLILVLILAGGGVFYFKFTKAEIEIWPKTEIKNFTTKLTVDKTAKEFNSATNLIPAQIFEAERTLSDEFSSSGKALKEVKATGVIRAYNGYSTSPQILVVNTRFVSSEGKVFRSIEKVTVPGGRYEKGKFVSSYLDIKVRADKAGPEYNIAPSTFSIPGFAGTDRYTKFYGKSFESMAGGRLEEVPQVTEKDLEEAENTLTERAAKECENLLREKIPPEVVFLEKALKNSVLEGFSSTKAGAELEKFDYQVKVHSIAIVFKKEDLESFSKSFVTLKIPSEKKFNEEQLKINYNPETINFDSGKITLSLELEAKIYSALDEISFKKALLGKSLSEVNALLRSYPEIMRAEVRSWPFWAELVSKDIKRIKIRLNID